MGDALPADNSRVDILEYGQFFCFKGKVTAASCRRMAAKIKADYSTTAARLLEKQGVLLIGDTLKLRYAVSGRSIGWSALGCRHPEDSKADLVEILLKSGEMLATLEMSILAAALARKSYGKWK